MQIEFLNTGEQMNNYEEYFQKEIKKHRQEILYQSKKGYDFFVRVIDILFSVIAIIPVTLLIVILCIIIRIDSEGNPIFSQVRVGKNGKLIKIHKLRTMRKDAEANGQKWASENDSRITKVGKILRKYRLDEIPQFYDVLFGKLSLVGPRPEVPMLTKKFNKEIPGFVNRLLVKPGLSGWAQVNGGYNITPKEKYQRDIFYIENRGLKLYINIFIATLRVVFTGEDAL